MRGFDAAQRSYERMLAAGPPEPPLFTVGYIAEVAVGDDTTDAQKLEADLRERLGKDVVMERLEDHPDDLVGYEVSGELEDIQDADDASSTFAALLVDTSDPGIKARWSVIEFDASVPDPEDEEPDWYDIERDRQLEMAF